MKKFFDIMTVTTVLGSAISLLMFVGSQIPSGQYWYAGVATASMALLGATGMSEWLYDRGSRDEYDRTKRLAAIGGHDD